MAEISLKEKIEIVIETAKDFNHGFCDECPGKEMVEYIMERVEHLCWQLEDLTYEEQQALWKRSEGLKEMLASFGAFKCYIKEAEKFDYTDRD